MLDWLGQICLFIQKTKSSTVNINLLSSYWEVLESPIVLNWNVISTDACLHLIEALKSLIEGW